MKINIAYRVAEREQAAAAIDSLKNLFPTAKVKQTDLKDEYCHAYMVIFPQKVNKSSTAGNG